MSKILTEENYRAEILAMTQQDWQPLLDLIPEIETTVKFGEMAGGEEGANGIQMVYWQESPIISRFQTIVYYLSIIIDFDWSSWDEGRQIVNDEEFDYNTIDIPTKCKVITAIVRNNRFCEGALIEAFESGLMLKILKSIQNQLTDH